MVFERLIPALSACTALFLLAACSTATTTVTAPASPSAVESTAPTEIVNVWSNPGSVSAQALPLGDSKLSTTGAAVGSLYSCQGANPNAPGAQVVGPWIHGDTWDSTAKTAVQGSVTWPTAAFTVSTDSGQRVIATNDLPVDTVTGTFPVAASDPAAVYDRNPNAISDSQSLTFSLPLVPQDSATPNCLGMGAIGVLLNGVVLFSAVDARGDDAVAHEEQDVCQGHPQQQGTYHYHSVPQCLQDSATQSSTVVGWAADGYPIVVERDASGALPNNSDLDECHGRTSPILIDGQVVEQYHYSATLEYPYTIGCLTAPSALR